MMGRGSRGKGGKGEDGGLAGVRIHKYLAGLGVGSRRAIEGWIGEGRVRVDGRVARIGERVEGGERITIRGEDGGEEVVVGGGEEGRERERNRNRNQGRARVLIYHKPVGEICTRKDGKGRRTVFEGLPGIKGGRWVAVGRLDLNTSGLLLFTDDGEVAHRLQHPRFNLEREYLCRVYGEVDAGVRERLVGGVRLGGEVVRFVRVGEEKGEGRNRWYSVVVMEGKYREVRRVWEAVGCRVSRLVRVRYGGVRLPRDLGVGKWRELGRGEVGRLLGN